LGDYVVSESDPEADIGALVQLKLVYELAA